MCAVNIFTLQMTAPEIRSVFLVAKSKVSGFQKQVTFTSSGVLAFSKNEYSLTCSGWP